MAIDIQAIKRRSQAALCGAFEREVLVDSSKVAQTKRIIIQAGNIIVGTGPGPFGKTKIWYNPTGMNF